MLINNNYSNRKVDALINRFVQNKQATASPRSTDVEVIPIYYQNQTHNNCLLDEKILKEIVYRNTKCCDPKQKLKIICYYKNLKTRNLVMKNNLGPKLSNLSQTGVVYNFECPLPHSRAENYIGMTQATVAHRLTNHTQSGSISRHFEQHHNTKLIRDTLVNNTSIIAKADNRYKLAIKEALLILNQEPSINKQFDNFTNILKLYSNRKSDIRPEICIPVSQVPRDQTELRHTKTGAQNVGQTPEGPDIVIEDESIYIHNENQATQDTIPDMLDILGRFGVGTNFREITLDQYLLMVFGDNDFKHDITISQRIKSMVRAARKKSSIL